MPSWSEEELQEAARFMYPTLKSVDIKRKFYQLGGVARGVLDLPSRDGTVDPVAELHSAIDRATIEEVRAG